VDIRQYLRVTFDTVFACLLQHMLPTQRIGCLHSIGKALPGRLQAEPFRSVSPHQNNEEASRWEFRVVSLLLRVASVPPWHGGEGSTGKWRRRFKPLVEYRAP